MHAVVGPDITREGGYAFDSLTPQNFLPSDQPRLISDWAVGRTSFGCRWLLAPYYLGLSISLLVLLIKFVQRTDKLFFDALVSSSSEVVTLVLSLIDFSLIASLGLMVMLACHENFVSGFELGRYRCKPSWTGHIDFGELKLKLLTSIVAVSAIYVLEIFMNIAAGQRSRTPLDRLLFGPASRGHVPHFSGSAPVNQHRPGLSYRTLFAAVPLLMVIGAGVAMAQTANSNAGLEGGQDNLFDAILATPNHITPVLPDNVFATAPGLEEPARIPQFTLNALAPGLFNSNAQFLKSGGSKAFEGSPLVRLGWASQLFESPIRISGAASFETERFVNGPGAAIDYIRPSARAQYTNPQDDQDFSPYLSYVPRLDFDPTFANNFATRQDLNLGIDKVFNFDGAFNRLPAASESSSATVWSLGFNLGAQRRFRDPSPQSYAFFFNPSVGYVISDQWNASVSMAITRRWFDTLEGVNQRNLTWEPTGVVEYVIPADWLDGVDAARWRGNPAIDFVAGLERNWSNISGREYTQWRVGIVFKTGWRF
jgi:uncharacterized protein (TIGR00645 family)